MAAADGTLGALYELAEAGGLGVKVGILEGATHKDKKGRSVSIVEYAMANEYGTRRIQSRAAFRTTADERMGEWEEMLAGLIQGGLEPRKALKQVGEQVVADIQEAIDEWKNPENAPSTIARKRGKENDPLMDSGDMMRAVKLALTGPGE